MRGSVIGFDVATATGAISGLDDGRYEFVRADWRAASDPNPGDQVDFAIEGQTAKAIFLVAPAPAAASPRTSWVQFFLSPTGRVSRRQYWLHFVLPLWAIGVAVVIVEALLGQQGTSPAGGYAPGWMYDLYAVAFLWPTVAVAIKRIHDRGRSGWFWLVLLIPVVQLWPWFEISFLKGTEGPNRFGPDPTAKG